MSVNGIPELSTQRCGEEIARMRTVRRLSRARLVARIGTEIEEDDPCADSISESWLKRLETGVLVKLPRPTLEAICRALRCTPRERARVLLLADRSALAGDDAPDAVAEALAFVTLRLHEQAHAVMADLIGQRRASELTEAEIMEITATALELLARRTQRK